MKPLPGELARGPLRLLRRHLPLKGEDTENRHVLPLQGEVARRAGGGLNPHKPPKRPKNGDIRSSPPDEVVREGRSSPRKPGGVRGSKAPGAKRTGGAAVVSPEPTSTKDPSVLSGESDLAPI